MVLSSTKFYQSESNNTLKRSYTMTKWALSQGTPGECAVTTAEMTAKHVDYHTHLAEKAVRSFESTDSSFERRSTVS